MTQTTISGEDPLTATLFNRKAIRASLDKKDNGSSIPHLRSKVDGLVKTRRMLGMTDMEIVADIVKTILLERDRVGGLQAKLEEEEAILSKMLGADVQFAEHAPFVGETFSLPDGVKMPTTEGSIITKRSPSFSSLLKDWEPKFNIPLPREKGIDPVSDDDMSAYLNSCLPENRLIILDGMIAASMSGKREKVRTTDGLHWELRGDMRGGNLDFLKLLRWMAGPLVLQKQDGTKYHDLIEALQKGDRLYRFGMKEPLGPPPEGKEFGVDAPLFHIEHDWASLFAKSSEAPGMVQLPFPYTAFEMVISRVRVCSIAYQLEDTKIGLTLFAEISPKKWMTIAIWEYSENGPWEEVSASSSEVAWKGNLIELVGKQIIATSIMLESEVAESEIVRAPHKLNKARQRRGERPLKDYHVVKLAKRHRTSPLNQEYGGDKRRSPRLHFRRGHWVHYANHKTWRKWCLVGDVELGWVDKMYEL